MSSDRPPVYHRPIDSNTHSAIQTESTWFKNHAFLSQKHGNQSCTNSYTVIYTIPTKLVPIDMEQKHIC